MDKNWVLVNKNIEYEDIIKETKLDENILRIIVNRGIKDKKSIIKYIKGSIKDMYSPFLILGMKEGVDILKEGIKNKEKIFIYGDYDCDGITSTAILYKGLIALGGNVEYYLPDRVLEGYGLNNESIKDIKSKGGSILLTCDNGISSFEEVNYAKSLGFKVIITDHHEIKGELPLGDAIINTKREGDSYPFKNLSGAGISLKVVEALFKEFNFKNSLDEYIELASIGTICDIVEVLDENRIIVKEGLKILNDSSNIGILSLIEKNNIKEFISSYHVGFILGPCLNATGRLENAKLSVELLITKDREKADFLSEKLVSLNKERKELTEEGYQFVYNEIIKEDYRGKVLVVYHEKVRESIAGIVAGRIKEKFNLPTFVITRGKNNLKGSGRSIENYNMFLEMSKCSSLFLRYGGHPMAAGFSIEEGNYIKLREELNKNCTLSDKDVIPKIKVDSILDTQKITIELIQSLKILEPFGKGNERGVFASLNVFTENINFYGKDKNVISFTFSNKKSGRIKGVLFNYLEEFKEKITRYYGEEELNNIIQRSKFDKNLDIVYYLDINEYNGNIYPSLKIIDFRPSKKSS